MSRMRETEPDKAESANTDGADRASFTARLQIILQHWPSTDRLARAMGVSPSAFRKWLRGEAEPSRERLIALADAAKIDVGWLVRGKGPTPVFTRPPGPGGGAHSGEPSAIDTNRFVLLPRQPEQAAASVGHPRGETPATGYMAFRHDWVRATLGIEPADLAMETALGESMLPTIHDGDLLLVDTTDRGISSFGVYVLAIRGERLVKRVQRKLDGSLVLISDNPSYETDQVAADMLSDVAVIGRVVWAGGTV